MAGVEFHEEHLTVARTARYYRLGELHDRLRQIWIVCHGYGQLAGRFVRLFEPIADDARLVVAPEALSRFYLDPRGGRSPDARIGASWMTREDREHEIADQIAYLDQLHDALVLPRRDRVSLHVLGFSQGAATAARWLARGRARADQLVLWGGVLPADVDPGDAGSPLRGTPICVVAGDEDDFATSEVVERQAAALRAAGVAHEVRRFAGGHRIDPDVLRALAGPA